MFTLYIRDSVGYLKFKVPTFDFEFLSQGNAYPMLCGVLLLQPNHSSQMHRPLNTNESQLSALRFDLLTFNLIRFTAKWIIPASEHSPNINS